MIKQRIRRLLSLSAIAATFMLGGCDERVFIFHPQGPVARTEMRLIILSIVLVAIVVIPTLILLWYIVHKFRDRPNNNAPYEPEWSESKTLEIIWWTIPIVIVGVLGAFTVRTTFALTKPPEETAKAPITIEVTSLDWKWLFQYPGQNVATVNYCTIPAGTPVNFVLTSNAPMNSFWVPQLGGQEYTMAGMAMRLWLQADKPGVYYGHGANFSGKGYAHMQFNVIAKSKADFDQWVQNVRRNSPPLTRAGYTSLVKPSVIGQLSFSSFPPDIFDSSIMKDGGMYMKHDNFILNGTKH